MQVRAFERCIPLRRALSMEVNNLPKQLKIVIGVLFSGLLESPLFL